MNDSVRAWPFSLDRRPPWVWALPLLLVLDLLVYGHFLVSGQVISQENADLSVGIWALDFLAGELRSGNLPLWNPYILSGTPYFATFQTLILYPPAWIYLLVSSGMGCNLYIIFHVFWIGVGMYWYLSRRDLHPFACVLGAVVLMFGSPTTLKIYPGHITVLSAMSWMPFLFVVFDALIEKKDRRPWMLLGTFFVAMQIAAGFPQHIFYTALAGGVYITCRALAMRESSWRSRMAPIGAFLVVYFSGACLMMVQLLTSWQATKETARSAALTFKFIGMCSFPPENFLTLLTPTLFGNEAGISYWGRWYFWEVVFFLGTGGLILALWALLSRRNKDAAQPVWLWSVLAVGFVVLGMGKYTPLLHFLYSYVPVFGSFRVSARALFEAAFFISALAALGLDNLLRSNLAALPRLKIYAVSVALTGLLLLAIGFWVSTENALPYWRSWLAAIGATGEFFFVNRNEHQNPQILAAAPDCASTALLIASISLIGFGAVLWVMQRLSWLRYALGGLAIIELYLFAVTTMPGFTYGVGAQPEVEKFLQSHPGDYRLVKKDFNNLAMKWHAQDMGGYESLRLRRYDEYIQWSQGKDPDETPTSILIRKYHPSYRMMRLGYVFDTDSHKTYTFPGVLPHVFLASRYRVMNSRDEIFKELGKRDFDFQNEVLLESEPNLRPSRIRKGGTVSVQVLDTDTMEIEADTPEPALLVVTDMYSKGWQATPLPGSSQQTYEVVPANYVLRAIPLAAGKHKIRLEYLPSAYVTGRLVSVIAWLIFSMAAAAYLLGRRKAAAKAALASG